MRIWEDIANVTAVHPGPGGPAYCRRTGTTEVGVDHGGVCAGACVPASSAPPWSPCCWPRAVAEAHRWRWPISARVPRRLRSPRQQGQAGCRASSTCTRTSSPTPAVCAATATRPSRLPRRWTTPQNRSSAAQPGDLKGPQYRSARRDYDAANRTCEVLLPNNGNGPSQAQVQQQLAKDLKFSKCMRSHGLPTFPDPRETSQGISISSAHGLARAHRNSKGLRRTVGPWYRSPNGHRRGPAADSTYLCEFTCCVQARLVDGIGANFPAWCLAKLRP